MIKPAVFVAKIVRAGPHAEFFQVVAHGREAAGMRGGGAQKIDGFFDVVEGNQIAEGLQAGKNIYGVAQILAEIVAKELSISKPAPRK